MLTQIAYKQQSYFHTRNGGTKMLDVRWTFACSVEPHNWIPKVDHPANLTTSSCRQTGQFLATFTNLCCHSGSFCFAATNTPTGVCSQNIVFPYRGSTKGPKKSWSLYEMCIILKVHYTWINTVTMEFHVNNRGTQNRWQRRHYN